MQILIILLPILGIMHCFLAKHSCCRYDTYLFYGYDRQKELTYVNHLSFLSKLMQSLGILSEKKTHAPRGSGARDTYELK